MHSQALPGSTQTDDVEPAIRAKGEEIFALMEAHPSPGIFSRKGAYARLMEWSMKDPVFKTQLFRFVDVLPALESSAEIVRHLQEYLGDKAVELNPALKAGLAASSFAPALVAGPVKSQIADMARQFVPGETGADLIRQIRRNAKLGFATTIDLLGETVVSEDEAGVFLRRNLEILDSVSEFCAQEPEPCFSDIGPDGPLPRLNLSVKISALTPDVHPADPGNSIHSLKERLRPVLRRAAGAGALINFDMESYKLKGLTLALFKSIFEEPEFAGEPAIGIAMQAYLRDCEKDLHELVAWARARNRRMHVRLVKGAYWDYETILAQQREWPEPVWRHKPESDACYERLTVFLLENTDIISPDFASHNVRSCAHAIVQAERLGVDPRRFEFQALHGMADELKSALLKLGHRVREYCAIGELLPGMAYLVRRLLENTSNEGFLRLKNMGEATKEQLLENPAQVAQASPPASPKPAGGTPALLFRNAANTDYSIAANRTAQLAALKHFEATRLGHKWPVIINGVKITGLTVAPLVAGNCVIMKPARQTSIIGAFLMDILVGSGVPAGALHYLPCSGADAGAHLVAHPKIDFVAFTGSREVGLGIREAAGKTRPGQFNLKKVVCEMGGKNAMIIDNDADLDEAIPAALCSAFGFAGQKCSALSRLIVLEGVHDRFVKRFLAACPSVSVGDPSLPGTIVNPVIDGAAQKSILEYIEAGKKESKLAWQAGITAEMTASGGYYVPPTVFTGCKAGHKIVREEIFGPVLAILKAKDLDEAFAIANDNDHALTGGFFSRSPRSIERAKAEFLVGNLYINRGCTGAVVQRHPFGGFKMSGGGTKAGGREYLENFMFPRLIAENVMRRGFTPPEEE